MTSIHIALNKSSAAFLYTLISFLNGDPSKNSSSAGVKNIGKELKSVGRESMKMPHYETFLAFFLISSIR